MNKNNTYYLIISHDGDPRNCSCKKILINAEYKWITDNNEGSDQWDTLIYRCGGFEGACKYLIDYLHDHTDTPGEGIKTEGCHISSITPEEIDYFFKDSGV